MNVIIRLQELPWSANAMDIRKFFSGLHIPEGGVHIVGGAAGDAFIAFASDEDARQAMLLTGGTIHGSNVRLLLSSRTEMQKVIEVARTAPMTPSAPAPSPANIGAPAPFPGYPGPPMAMSVPTNAPSKNDDMHRSQGRSRSRSRSPRPRKRSTDSWGRGGAPAPPPVGNDNRLALEVRGMPLWATVADLHELFSAFRVVPGGIRVFPSSDDPGTAVGIVRFVSPRVREDAFRRAPRKLRGQVQVVIVYTEGNGDNGNGNCAGGLPERGSIAEDSSRRESQLRARQPGKRVLELSGLPFGCHDEDIRRFLKGCDIRSVYISHDDAGRPTGQAIVEMVSDADVVVALKLDREKLGNRTVQVNLASPGNRGIEPEPVGRNAEDEDLSEPTDCCLVQKLPHDATDRDVVHFFSEMGVVPVTIHLMLNKGGQPSGDAFCVFQTADDCRRALKKRCGFVGNQFVHAQPVRREKMREALGHLPPFSPDRGPIANRQRRPQQEVYPRVQMNKQPDERGDPNEVMPGDFPERRQYPEGDRNREQGYPNVERSMGQHADVNRNAGPYADVDRGIGQYPDVERNRAQFVENDRGRAHYPDVEPGRGPYGDADRNRGHYSEQNRAAMPDQRKSQGMRQPDRMSMSQLRQGRYNPRDPETFGNPGCVVSVTNIPYRATADDIVAFFGEYKLSSDCVIRRFNDVGMPMGEARVAFKARMDAESAVRSHNMKRMEGRPISVNFV